MPFLVDTLLMIVKHAIFSLLLCTILQICPS